MTALVNPASLLHSFPYNLISLYIFPILVSSRFILSLSEWEELEKVTKLNLPNAKNSIQHP